MVRGNTKLWRFVARLHGQKHISYVRLIHITIMVPVLVHGIMRRTVCGRRELNAIMCEIYDSAYQHERKTSSMQDAYSQGRIRRSSWSRGGGNLSADADQPLTTLLR